MLQSKPWDQKLIGNYESGIFGKADAPLHRACISGYSRTGKSTLVKRLFSGRCEHITFHTAMPLDDLIGGWALVNGATVWIDGPAVRALKNGTCLLIDEANNIPPECQTFFYALLDDPAGVTLPNGQRVEAAPGYCVIATMNPDPTCLPHPIYDRFDIYLRADTLSKGVKEALGRFAANAEAVIGFGQAPLTWKRPASVNAFLAANKLRSRGFSDEQIAEVLGWEGQDASDFLIAASSR
jgi:hypothetical protein